MVASVFVLEQSELGLMVSGFQLKTVAQMVEHGAYKTRIVGFSFAKLEEAMYKQHIQILLMAI